LGLSAASGTISRKRGKEPRQQPGLLVRRVAAAILRQVIERGSPLDAQLSKEGGNPHFLHLDQRDRALARAILGATLRRRGEIEAALANTLDRSLPKDAGTLSAILHVGAAQILFLDVPDHAAVSLAVDQAAADRATRNAKGLVNGVLRRIARERHEILASVENPGRLNTPDWLYERWRAAYGDETAAEITAAHLASPALDLSVKADPVSWATQLDGVVLASGTVRLTGTERVSDLPGFSEGAWWVQDAAAALPAKLLGPTSGLRVADLCAAPGGKTAELVAAGAAVTAVDISESRLKRLRENLQRLGLDADLVTADILKWEPEAAFDAVLLDAPCTATGTIRRHPDIPWLKRPADVITLAALQAKMLDRAAALVRPGGLLVYCTCSLEPEEGEAQVAPFLARHPDFTIVPIDPAEITGLSELVTTEGMLRTLPCQRFGPREAERGMDGFFAARFRRR
jgi:16S rRNA (cytosine967-C5)-methyltransferase